MKALKKSLALLLALMLVLALGTTAFAAESYSITVKNPNTSISMAGNTYSAYKLFNVTYSDVTETSGNYAYTVTNEFANFQYSYKTTEEGAEVTKVVSGEDLINYLATLSDNAEALDTFAEAALKYAEDNSIAAAGSVTAGAGATEATISVPSAGYYLVAGSATAPDNQTVVAACSLTTTDPTAEVTVKADVPSIEKKIVEADGTLVPANTASIGDTVTFQLSSKVPNMKGYEKYFFVMNDTLSEGLTYNGNDTMTVKIGDTTLTRDTDYTVETNGQNITIIFKDFIQYKDQAGTAVTVTYSATLNEKANLSPTEGNPNTVTLTYSNNPNETGSGTPENPDKPGEGDATGTTPQSQTKTYVTGIKINKVDGQDSTKKLVGAKFEIKGTALKVVLTNTEMFKASESGTWYMLKDGTYTEEGPTDDNTASYDSTTQKYEKVTVVTKDTVATEINTVGYTNADGVLTFAGLNAGEYVITELVAPSGYNLLKDSITITITENADFSNANWTVTEKVGDKDAKTLSAGADNLFSFTVENNSGTELPSTGGMGTTLFYILGGLLVVGAGVVLVTKKRMSKSEN